MSVQLIQSLSGILANTPAQAIARLQACIKPKNRGVVLPDGRWVDNKDLPVDNPESYYYNGKA